MYEENYESLANAVILLAVKDLRAAYRRLMRHPDDRAARGEVESLKWFFRSKHFNTFTALDGPALLEKIIDEMEGKQ